MKVYVGTYAKYSSGSIGGQWVDLTDFSDKEEFIDHCKEIHSDENDPELMFQDHEVPNLLESLIEESFIDPKLWDLIDYFERERIDIEDEHDLVSLWNEHCDGDDYIMNWESVEDLIESLSGMDAFNLGAYSTINWSDEFFRFDGYGNLESTCNPLGWIDEGILLDKLLELV